MPVWIFLWNPVIKNPCFVYTFMSHDEACGRPASSWLDTLYSVPSIIPTMSAKTHPSAIESELIPKASLTDEEKLQIIAKVSAQKSKSIHSRWSFAGWNLRPQVSIQISR